jgi:hypothetical protein
MTRVSEDRKIWRYLDFTKFVYLLKKEALIFTRVDKLEDQFEGSYSRPTIDDRQKEYTFESGLSPETLSEVFEKFRAYTFVNCWHINEYESAALWDLYTKGAEGIAILSTDKKLRDALPKNVLLDHVTYIDYDKDLMRYDNPLYTFFYKRKSYEHEHELRAAFLCLPREGGGYHTSPPDINFTFDLNEKLPFSAYPIPVDLDSVIDEMRVHPLAEDWFKEVVESG